MVSLKKIFVSSIFTVNIVVIVLLFLSAFSDRISPEKTVWFSFLGMVFPFILAINLLFACWWLCFLQWRQFVVCIIALLCCGNAINRYFPLHKKTKSIPEKSIKVLTYNVMGFQHSSPHWKGHDNPILQYIIDSKADIVCIQESRTYEDMGEKLLSPGSLRNALSMYPYFEFMKIKTRHRSLGIYGLSVYSKYPILSSQKIDIGSNSIYNGAFYTEINVDGKKMTLINCHLETNNLSVEEREQYDKFIMDFNSKEVDAIAEKTVQKLKPAFRMRAKQADIVADFIKNTSNPYIVVCGDFNDTPISYTNRTVRGDLKDSFAETGFGPGITYNQNHFYFRIDYIFHSSNIKSYNCTVDRFKASDHYPVYTWLELK